MREGGIVREECQADAQLLCTQAKKVITLAGVQTEKEMKTGTLLRDGDAIGEGAGLKGVQHSCAAGTVFFPQAGQVLFIISAGQEAGQDILVHDRDGTGIKIQVLSILLQKPEREHHEPHTHGRGDGLGEGVHIDHAAAGVDTLKGGDGTANKAEFAVIVVLDDESAGFFGPSEESLPPGDRRDDP